MVRAELVNQFAATLSALYGAHAFDVLLHHAHIIYR